MMWPILYGIMMMAKEKTNIPLQCDFHHIDLICTNNLLNEYVANDSHITTGDSPAGDSPMVIYQLPSLSKTAVSAPFDRCFHLWIACTQSPMAFKTDLCKTRVNMEFFQQIIG